MALDFGVGWVFVGIVILVIFVVVALVKKRQSMATAVVTFASIFFVLSIGYVFIINDVQMNSFSSIADGTKIYFNWLYSAFGKAVDITSYAIKQDWTANSTLGR